MLSVWRAVKRVPQFFNENRTADRLLSIAIYVSTGSAFWVISGTRVKADPSVESQLPKN